ncbi:hypothetical protein [Microvirga massiliensis]|uniref:hypothetical protein n=1 Tax=Microvirga massiliensis TaxID=1033741 RepID=UPI00062B44D0|nr:hypothetical protein [Microvirga massiliensis]
MPDIVFPISSAPGARGRESAGRLVNGYAETLEDGRIVRRRVPGLAQVFEVEGSAHLRGFILVDATLYLALDGRLASAVLTGTTWTVTDLGALPGTGPVTFARNNRSPVPDVVSVADGAAYVISPTAPPASYPDPDVGAPNAVTAIDGYFVFTYGDARARSTGLNTIAINTLDTAFAEAKPDGLRRGITFRGELFLMGLGTIEVWQNTGNPVGFPFSRVTVIPRGLAGPSAAAGFEDGWTNTLLFVGDDAVVYRLDGYTPVRVSTHPVERAIEGLPDRTALEAFVFMAAGHAFWVLRSPAWCWVYDLTMQSWHERRSHGSATFRASQSVRAFGKWLVGDQASGKVFEISEAMQREGSDPLVLRVESLSTGDFPNRATASRLDIDIVTGTGVASGLDPIETQPVCLVSWSRDGGATFGEPMRRAIGAQGHVRQRVNVNRLGLIEPAGLVIAVECADPVPFTLIGAHVGAGRRAR